MYHHHERDKIRRPCIAYLRQMIFFNQLNRYSFLYWTCPPDMGKQKPQVIRRMKKDGYEAGVYDLTIIAGNAGGSISLLIEFKYGSNQLTNEQEIIWDSSVDIKNVYTFIIRDIQSFIALVEKYLK